MIQREDVLSVAQDLGLSPSEEQIQEVLEEFESAADNDSSATWDLVVEQLLYNKL